MGSFDFPTNISLRLSKADMASPISLWSSLESFVDKNPDPDTYADTWPPRLSAAWPGLLLPHPPRDQLQNSTFQIRITRPPYPLIKRCMPVARCQLIILLPHRIGRVNPRPYNSNRNARICRGLPLPIDNRTHLRPVSHPHASVHISALTATCAGQVRLLL